MSERVHVMGTWLDPVTQEEAVEQVVSWMLSDEPGGRHVVTANPEMVMTALADAAFADVLQQADLVVADGIGLVWASRMLAVPVPERIAGIDLAEALLARAAEHGRRVFFLGAEPGVAEQAAAALSRRYAGLQIVGTHHGYFSGDEENDLVATIEQSDADLVLVAMGVPRQELWIARMRPRLPVRVWIGVGGAFDVFAGKVRRAPRWIQRLGLEWLYRICQEPRRRLKRALVLPRFAVRVLMERWAARRQRQFGG